VFCSKSFRAFLKLFPSFLSFSNVLPAIQKQFKHPSNCSKAFEASLKLFPSFSSIHQAFQASHQLFQSFSSIPEHDERDPRHPLVHVRHHHGRGDGRQGAAGRPGLAGLLLTQLQQN
jgi:hypothetical protein